MRWQVLRHNRSVAAVTGVVMALTQVLPLASACPDAQDIGLGEVSVSFTDLPVTRHDLLRAGPTKGSPAEVLMMGDSGFLGSVALVAQPMGVAAPTLFDRDDDAILQALYGSSGLDASSRVSVPAESGNEPLVRKPVDHPSAIPALLRASTRAASWIALFHDARSVTRQLEETLQASKSTSQNGLTPRIFVSLNDTGVRTVRPEAIPVFGGQQRIQRAEGPVGRAAFRNILTTIRSRSVVERDIHVVWSEQWRSWRGRAPPQRDPSGFGGA